MAKYVHISKEYINSDIKNTSIINKKICCGLIYLQTGPKEYIVSTKIVHLQIYPIIKL